MFYFDLAVKSSKLLAATNPSLIILKWGTDKPLYHTLHLTEFVFFSVPRLSVRYPGHILSLFNTNANQKG